MKGLSRGRRLWRGARAAVVVVIAMSMLLAVASPASATDQKLSDQTLSEWPEGSSVPNFHTDAAGNVTQDAACPTIPGVTRTGKVWAAVYTTPSVKLRFTLMTRYQAAVATAKVAIEQTQHREPSCSELYSYVGDGQVPSLRQVACQPGAAGRPNRWCQLASLPTHPASVNMPVENCRNPGLNHGTWGPLEYTSWHNTPVQIDRVNLIAGISQFLSQFISWNAGVYFDDFDMVGGVAPIDTSVYGRFVGYGKVQTAGWSEWNVLVYDYLSRQLGWNPLANPVGAHQAVQNHIDNNWGIPGIGPAGTWYHNFLQVVCDNSPWLKNVLDVPPPGSPFSASDVALDTMFRGWVDQYAAKNTGVFVKNFVCHQVLHSSDAALRSYAPLICIYGLIPWFFHIASANDGPLVFGKFDLGTGHATHYIKMIGLFRQFLS